MHHISSVTSLAGVMTSQPAVNVERSAVVSSDSVRYRSASHHLRHITIANLCAAQTPLLRFDTDKLFCITFERILGHEFISSKPFVRTGWYVVDRQEFFFMFRPTFIISWDIVDICGIIKILIASDQG